METRIWVKRGRVLRRWECEVRRRSKTWKSKTSEDRCGWITLAYFLRFLSFFYHFFVSKFHPSSSFIFYVFLVRKTNYSFQKFCSNFSLSCLPRQLALRSDELGEEMSLILRQIDEKAKELRVCDCVCVCVCVLCVCVCVCVVCVCCVLCVCVCVWIWQMIAFKSFNLAFERWIEKDRELSRSGLSLTLLFHDFLSFRLSSHFISSSFISLFYDKLLISYLFFPSDSKFTFGWFEGNNGKKSEFFPPTQVHRCWNERRYRVLFA